MSKELDTINELLGDALAGVRLTLTALRSIQNAVIEGNAVAASPSASVSVWTCERKPGEIDPVEVKTTPSGTAIKDLQQWWQKATAGVRTRKPRSDKGKKRKGTVRLSLPRGRKVVTVPKAALSHTQKRARKPRK